jgi:hypothetical protein
MLESVRPARLTPEQRARADLLRKIKPYVQAGYGT